MICKLVVLFALVAAASAGYLASPYYSPYSLGASPYAYSSYYSPYSYSAYSTYPAYSGYNSGYNSGYSSGYGGLGGYGYGSYLYR